MPPSLLESMPPDAPARSSALRWETMPVGRIDELEAYWRALHTGGWPTPVLDYAFAAALIKAFARGDEVAALARIGDRPVALGVMQRDSRLGWSTFQPSQAPVGLWLHDPAAADLGTLARTLLAALPQPALMLGLTQQDPLRAARPRDSGTVQTLDYIETGSVRIDRPFEAYWGERDRKVRYEMKRRLARLAEQGLLPRLERIVQPEAACAAVDAFGELESAGWKAVQGTAVHAGNAQGAFYRDVMARFCRAGAGRIYRYAAGARVLAMQLCVEHDGTLAFLKTTYDERLRACAPGVLMKAEIFRDLFADPRLRRVEFYGGVKEWQRKWIDELRTQYHVNVYRTPLLGVAHRLAHRVRRRAAGA